MVVRNERGEVRAAGGVVCRRGGAGDVEVLLVHRRAYDDWTIPKGKAEAGESDEACALREVEEETGLRCRLLDELPCVRWRDRFGRPKIARYWRLEPIDPAAARPRNEVDEVWWSSITDAIARLSYPRDAVVLEAVAEADQTLER